MSDTGEGGIDGAASRGVLSGADGGRGEEHRPGVSAFFGMER